MSKACSFRLTREWIKNHLYLNLKPNPYTLIRICFFKDLLDHSVKYFHVGHWFRRMVLMQFAHSFFLELFLFSALENCIHCAKYQLIRVTIPDAWPLNSSEISTFNCSVLRQQTNIQKGMGQNDGHFVFTIWIPGTSVSDFI